MRRLWQLTQHVQTCVTQKTIGLSRKKYVQPLMDIRWAYKANLMFFLVKKTSTQTRFCKVFLRGAHIPPKSGTLHEFLQQGHCSSLQQLVGIRLGARIQLRKCCSCVSNEICIWRKISFLDKPKAWYRIAKFLNWGTPCEKNILRTKRNYTVEQETENATQQTDKHTHTHS